MKLTDLTKAARDKLDKKLNIVSSISILNIPKQSLLEKGDLIILLDNNDKPILTEFFRDGFYHFEFKFIALSENIITNILKSDSLKLFETPNFNEELDKDFAIDYMNIDTDTKRDIRAFMKSSEKKLIETHSRFGKFSKDNMMKSITAQNGMFTLWMNEHNFTKPDTMCLLEAFEEANKNHDFPLKKRASFAKCFYKISEMRNSENGKNKKTNSN